MKASELREIVDIVSKLEDFDLGFDFDYNDILKLSADDVELVLENKNNDNVLVLIQFFIYYNRNKDNEWFLKSLKHIEGLDVADVVTEKIISANSIKEANVIYDYFACDEIVSLFKTKEEWEIYLDELFYWFDDDAIPHFMYFIEKFKDLQNIGIKKVMRFIGNIGDDLIEEIKYLDNPSFTEEEWSNIFDLIYEGYEKDGVFKLVARFKEYREQKIYKEEISKILKYLIQEEDNFNEDLPKFFSITSFEYADDIVKLLRKIKSDDMFRHYINSSNSYVEIILRKYFSTILNTEIIPLQEAYYTLGGNNMRYFNDLVKESSEEKEENIDSCTKIEKIMQTLENICNREDDADGLYQLVNYLPVVPYETWDFIVNKFDLTKAKLILMNYDSLVCFIENAFSYLNRFENISYANLEIIFNLIRLESFRQNDNMLELYELMLKEENQKSLECIYQFYLEQDKKQKQKSRDSMELKSSSIETVASLLNREWDLDMVLDGFDDSDEITPNTLVRSLKYKTIKNR